MDLMALGERIRWILQTLEIGQRELARRAKISEPAINLLLKRLETRPGAVELSTLEGIARGAGVSLAWLVTGEGEAMGSGGPIFPRTHGELPTWAALRSEAEDLEPGTPPWVFDRVASTPPVLPHERITPAYVLDMAKLIRRYAAPADLASVEIETDSNVESVGEKGGAQLVRPKKSSTG